MKILRSIQILLLTLLAGLLLTQAAFSLRWLITHDEAPLLYEAFLMQSQGLMPYRDIFDFQMPGAYIVYYLLGILTNFGPFRLRVLDLAILITLLTITFLFMRRFGTISALAAALLFGLKYMQGGAFMAIQREYLFLPFIALALWINLRENLTYRDHLITGLLLGLAAIIKPHAALGLLPLAVFHMANLRKRSMNFLLPAGIGFIIPVALVTLWLALTHSLLPFIDIARNYWPLYAQVNGQMEITPVGTRLSFLFTQGIRIGGYGIWILPSLIGLYLVPRAHKKYAYLLAGITACYAVYPVFTGQFFEYHYIPLAYSFALLASLALAENNTADPKSATPPARIAIRAFSTFALVAAILVNIRPSDTFIRQLDGRPLTRTTDRASQIAKYLEDNLQAGDTVQPLDWTGGTLLAMLQTRAPLATSYVFDFYFYHHVSTPYIQSLRSDFMRQLTEQVPRFIVEITSMDKPWINGEDTPRDFPELRGFLNENYSVEVNTGDYLIYKRH